MPPLSTLDMHEARGLPRSTLRDECFQRYDRPEGIPRHFSQEYNTSTALEQAEMPDGKIDERSPDMYAHRRGASGHSRSLRSPRSLKGLTIKHTARGLDQKLSPTRSTGQISAQWARVYAHGMLAGMLRPTLTASRDVFQAHSQPSDIEIHDTGAGDLRQHDTRASDLRHSDGVLDEA